MAEIKSVLPAAKIVKETGTFLIVEHQEIPAQEFLNRLGGSIKIGKVISDKIDKEKILNILKDQKQDRKLNFGFSYYESKKDNLGMEIKTTLKADGISCRLVTGRDKALSSVIVTKNRVVEFLVLANHWLALTEAVQEFEAYGHRDYGRPVRDMLSGSLPPKLAQIMINLAGLPTGVRILDPFCGSGTILQEGSLLGYQMIGSDLSPKAVADSKQNLAWAVDKLGINKNYQISHLDVHDLSKTISQVEGIVTEPYLGPPLRGYESKREIEKIVEGLSELYLSSFREFKKILDAKGRIVIVFPAWRLGQEIIELPILEKIKKLGFTQINKDKLVYSREGQKVWRQIYVFGLVL
ncbi:MAG: DNA methyltransferase [Patescibacteria group bacterium]|nr:DNA methyltransferase [Patescibacteria group bacterium]